VDEGGDECAEIFLASESDEEGAVSVVVGIVKCAFVELVIDSIVLFCKLQIGAGFWSFAEEKARFGESVSMLSWDGFFESGFPKIVRG